MSDETAESVIELLVIKHADHFTVGLPKSYCVRGSAHGLRVARVFNVAGVAICEECVKDMAPVMAALASALNAEREARR